jgi:hypothetical protein
MYLNIQTKEDSAEKLAAAAGKPTKNFLFAQELNTVVNSINTLRHLITLNEGNINYILSNAIKIELGVIEGSYIDVINEIEEVSLIAPVFITYSLDGVFFVKTFVGNDSTYGTSTGLSVSEVDFLPVYQSDVISVGSPVNIQKGDFDGVFDMSNGVNNFYNDYTTGGSVTLSLSDAKVLGTICKVRVRGNLLNQVIPDNWVFRGDAFTSNPLFFNDILISFISDDEIILLNELLQYSFEQEYPNQFSLEKAWHKFDIATTTEVGGLVSLSSDSLTTTPFNLTATGSVTRSVQNLKECVFLNSSHLKFAISINNIFQNSFSVSMKIKLIDGHPTATRYLCSYRVSATSRFWIDYRTDGKVTVAYTSNSVTVFAQSLNAVFADGAMIDFNHLVVTIENSVFIKIYYNGVILPLSASLNGNMSTVNMSLFETSNEFFIGYDAAAAVYSNMYVKDFVIQPIVYDQNKINNLLSLP